MMDDDTVKVAESIADKRRKSPMKLASKTRKEEIEARIEEILGEIANKIARFHATGDFEDWVLLPRC